MKRQWFLIASILLNDSNSEMNLLATNSSIWIVVHNKIASFDIILITNWCMYLRNIPTPIRKRIRCQFSVIIIIKVGTKCLNDRYEQIQRTMYVRVIKLWFSHISDFKQLNFNAAKTSEIQFDSLSRMDLSFTFLRLTLSLGDTMAMAFSLLRRETEISRTSSLSTKNILAELSCHAHWLALKLRTTNNGWYFWTNSVWNQSKFFGQNLSLLCDIRTL